MLIDVDSVMTFDLVGRGETVIDPVGFSHDTLRDVEYVSSPEGDTEFVSSGEPDNVEENVTVGLSLNVHSHEVLAVISSVGDPSVRDSVMLVVGVGVGRTVGVAESSSERVTDPDELSVTLGMEVTEKETDNVGEVVNDSDAEKSFVIVLEAVGMSESEMEGLPVTSELGVSVTVDVPDGVSTE